VAHGQAAIDCAGLGGSAVVETYLEEVAHELRVGLFQLAVVVAGPDARFSRRGTAQVAHTLRQVVCFVVPQAVQGYPVLRSARDVAAGLGAVDGKGRQVPRAIVVVHQRRRVRIQVIWIQLARKGHGRRRSRHHRSFSRDGLACSQRFAGQIGIVGYIDVRLRRIPTTDADAVGFVVRQISVDFEHTAIAIQVAHAQRAELAAAGRIIPGQVHDAAVLQSQGIDAILCYRVTGSAGRSISLGTGLTCRIRNLPGFFLRKIAVAVIVHGPPGSAVGHYQVHLAVISHNIALQVGRTVVQGQVHLAVRSSCHVAFYLDSFAQRVALSVRTYIDCWVHSRFQG